ncbi:hypothetical protein HT031_000089 [Scenedesmus sp. PABB004]|nr:hypothetical protein HT031_000089 [Scenedesmus sp. PABB004]
MPRSPTGRWPWALGALLLLAGVAQARHLQSLTPAGSSAAAWPAWAGGAAAGAGRKLAQTTCQCTPAVSFGPVADRRCLDNGLATDSLQCTAGDMQLVATSFQIIGPTCTSPESYVTLALTVNIKTMGNERYAIGTFLSTNGLSPLAVGSSCAISALPKLGSANATGCGSNLKDFDGDVCGDLTKPQGSGDNPGVTCDLPSRLTVKCVPLPGDNKLVIPTCFAYSQNARNSGSLVINTTVPVGNPSIDVQLSTNEPQYTSVGQLRYASAQVKNTGNVPLTSVTVTYAGQTLTCPNLPVSLEWVTCTASNLAYTVTPADMADGDASLTATASGVYTSTYTGARTTVNDTASIRWTLNELPSVSFDKSTSTPRYADAGDVLRYSFTIINTGNVALTLNLQDAMLNAGSLACTPSLSAPLASLATMTCTGAHTVTRAEASTSTLTNTATLAWTTPGGKSGSVSDLTSSSGSALGLSLDITAEETRFSTPSTVHFTVTATNTGEAALTNVVVNLQLEGGAAACTVNGAPVTWPLASLAVGASFACQVTYAATQADLNNANTIVLAGTATASGPNGVLTVGPVPDSAESVPSILATAQLLLENTAETPVNAAGPVRYELTVRNTGNVDLALSNLVLASDGTGAAPVLGGCSPAGAPGGLPASLAVGASVTCNVTYVFTLQDIGSADQSVTVSANLTTAGGGEAPEQSFDDAIRTTAPEVKLTFTGVAAVDGVEAGKYDAVGDAVTLAVELTNTGNVLELLSLTSVRVGGEPVTIVGCTPSTAVAPGATVSCTTAPYVITQADLDAGSISVVVNGQATNTEVQQTTGASTTLALQALPWPALSLAKRVVSGSNFSRPGNVVVFELVANNTGNIKSPTDSMIPDLTGAACGESAAGVDLAVGATLTCGGSYTVAQADIDAGSIVNTGSVSGSEPSWAQPPRPEGGAEGGDAGPSVFDTDNAVAAAAQSPALQLEKTANTTTLSAPGVVSYTIVATNVGNVGLTSVAIADPRVPSLACTPAQPAALAPGAVLTCTGSITFDQAAMEGAAAGHINTATATSPTLPAPVTAAETVTATCATGLAVSMVCPTSISAAGPVECDVTVTNNGNWRLTGLTASRTLTGCSLAGAAAPGGSVSCKIATTVSAAAFESGSPLSVDLTISGAAAGCSVVAAATSLTPGQTGDVTLERPVSQTVTMDVRPQVDIALTSTTTSISAAAPGTVVYSALVTNPAGANTAWTASSPPSLNVGTLAAVPMTCATLGPLAPGASVTCTASVALPAGICGVGASVGATVGVSVVTSGGKTASDTDALTIPCQVEAACAGKGECPSASVARAWFLQPGSVVATCTNCVGRMAIKIPFLNGKCQKTALSWVAAGVTGAGATCAKVEGIAYSQDLVLGGLKNGNEVFLALHDGSFNKNEPAFATITAGPYALPKGCRSNSAIQNCAPYVVGTFNACPSTCPR